ncbi:MAG: pseudouridine-5'-phosphate glycosidase [Syntrophothermus sp.]|uniref:pseudouridine-5'-phosphate glycosidase n=1 Tax=Syntrophothermus sp. TaxID=2736299 RepID=UPI00257CEF75|nr:pseudouridine-5'-phosphate glycosidase [Syntrophothermus sp.]NSW83293.1 pseudouridine-5'-phosphate glycosidase [Syntrophothermus sp.]
MTESKITGRVLVETALLGCGLPSVSNQTLYEEWPKTKRINLVWLQGGRIVSGPIEKFLDLRREAGWARVDARRLDTAVAEQANGYLTASAVMKLTAGKLIPVVTGGMGGVRQDTISADLVYLTKSPALLIASAPKDSVDLAGTVAYLREKGVLVLGVGQEYCDGFLFSREKVWLDRAYSPDIIMSSVKLRAGCVIFNPLPPGLRFNEQSLLEKALEYSYEASRRGQDFHPAVNHALDRLTGGRASVAQLEGLIANVKFALSLPPMACAENST